MTKLQEFMQSISKSTEAFGSDLPKYHEMTDEEKRTIDNLKKAVDEAIKVFSKYKGV